MKIILEIQFGDWLPCMSDKEKRKFIVDALRKYAIVQKVRTYPINKEE